MQVHTKVIDIPVALQRIHFLTESSSDGIISHW